MHSAVFILFDRSTWKSVDEPAELFLGDVGPAEVQSYWLPPDDATQHERCDGLATIQIDVLPKPLVTAPGGTETQQIISEERWSEEAVFQLHSTSCTHHLFQALQTRMQTQRSL